MKNVSCIIPAYNEGPRIGVVLSVVSVCPLISEIIVLDDGSVDNTAEIASAFKGVTVIRQQNMGKSATIAKGIRMAKGDFLLFLDSDLTGLTQDNLSRMISPVINGESDISISLRGYIGWRMIGLDPLSGERVIPKALIMEKVEEMAKLSSFGLEVFENRFFISKKVRIKIVLCKNLMSPFKSAKYGRWTGLKQDWGMIRQIFRIISIPEAFSQIIRLRAQRVK